MHIGYITADRGVPVFGTKGASIHVRQMVTAFAKLGHQVSVFAARRGPATEFLSADIHKVVVEGSLERLYDQDKARLREEYALAVSDKIAEYLVTIHKERPIDLIYERYGLFSTAGVRVARTLGIPCLVEVNSPLLLEQQKFRRLVNVADAESVEREVFEDADALFAVSAEVATYVNSKRQRGKQVHVVPNGVDTSRFHPGITGEIKLDSSFVIAFVGSLKPWHGLDTLMEAFRRLRVQGRNCNLLLIGEGPLRQWVEGYGAGAELDQHVSVTGWVDYERLPGLLACANVAVAPYPKLDDFYFSPLKLFEYLAIGLPVVASRIGQIEAQLRDEENVLFTEPGDASDLALKIARIMDDHTLAGRLAQNGVRCAAKRTWLDNARSVLAVARPLVAAA